MVHIHKTLAVFYIGSCGVCQREVNHRSWHLLSCFLILAPENMYVYEGKDYSKSSDADKKTFDQLLTGKATLKIFS